MPPTQGSRSFYLNSSEFCFVSTEEPTVISLNVFWSKLVLILVIPLVKMIKQPSLAQYYPDEVSRVELY